MGFENVEPRHVHPWRDPRGKVLELKIIEAADRVVALAGESGRRLMHEAAMEADMAKELKIGGKLESVVFDTPKNEMVITIRAPADNTVKDAVSVARNGQHVQISLNPWIKKIQDARQGNPKVQFNSLTPEGTDLEKLKGEVEAMGLVALKPHSEGQRGLAARVAMRTYSRLIREEDPEEAEVFWELANYFDKKAEGGTGS